MVSSEQRLSVQDETAEMLRDLLWLNAVIATELIQQTENTSLLARNASPPASCLLEHQALRETALSIAERYRPGTVLRTHLKGHQ
ncbi:MAG TPA: hypothetical protein VMS89_09610 [Methanoregulaceae archaeon]|nr:hypothetical protein [Methanoregulaceae archaeon]